MCPCHRGCTNKEEKGLPENELWQLYRAAYEQYQCEIIKGEKKYSRFVNDFIAYHLPTLCTHEDQIRLHVMHVFSIKELLEERCDLVDYFFSRENFEEKDYRQMEHLFNTGSTIESGKNVSPISRRSRYVSSRNLQNQQNCSDKMFQKRTWQIYSTASCSHHCKQMSTDM